ncbi:hypothetical protein BDW69DRAFT_103403 [Aspergillus filifer]
MSIDEYRQTVAALFVDHGPDSDTHQDEATKNKTGSHSQDNSKQSPGDKPNDDASNPDAKSASPHKIEFADVTQIGNGFEPQIFLTSRWNPGNKKRNKKVAEKYKHFALLLRQIVVDRHGQKVLESVQLEVQSATLCQDLRALIPYSYDDTDLTDEPIIIRQPFHEIFFARSAIKEAARGSPKSSRTRDELNLVCNFIDTDEVLSPLIRLYEKLVLRKRVSYQLLWTIYPPNSLMVVKIAEVQECWICRNIQVDRDGLYWLIGLRLGFDGVKIGLETKRFRMMPFHDGREINDLPVVPLSFWPDRDDLEASLKARGAQLDKLLGIDFMGDSHVFYKGPGWSSDEPQEGPKLEIDGRVILDFTTYMQEITEDDSKTKDETFVRPSLKFTDPPRKRASPIATFQRGAKPASGRALLPLSLNGSSDSDQDSEPSQSSDEEGTTNVDTTCYLKTILQTKYGCSDVHLIYPARYPAYVLAQKKWAWIAVDKIKPIKWNGESFGSLQMDERTKNLVGSLVSVHHKKDMAPFDDIIQGKGQGLIFLFHGEPGLGKTLTAESLAEHVEKPLYAVSGGELSTDVATLDNKINSIFKITTKWNAIVLLDEADVVMAKRTTQEIERNAIVAVFLRTIEYFQGILILTTNRKEDFDDAFQSRVHITISFPPLSAPVRAKIWKNMIFRNSKLVIDDSWSARDGLAFEILGELDLNGRKIKNILRTAVCYALAMEKPLGVSHVNEVIRIELVGNMVSKELDKHFGDLHLARGSEY